MRYVSTRGDAPVLSFGDTLLAGLAADGGLYVPERWPKLAEDARERFEAARYQDVAVEVMWPFVDGALTRDELAELVEEAYASFDDPSVVPVRALDDGYHLLELFHGPTLAFKDVALQLIGPLFEHELRRRRSNVTIVGATSGDTGSAAIEACRDRESIEIFILHPAGRVSEVQRRQMTTVESANVHNIAIEGTFDDCQDLVKTLFADVAFRERRRLSAVNSMNWARVMAQVVYYVASWARLGGGRVAYAVPTGNFGNVFSGYVASQLGVDVDQFVVGTNRNDILTRFFETGDMTMSEVYPTISPSMDIQVSSNFERLLFELYGRAGHRVAATMAEFRGTGSMTVPAESLQLLTAAWSGVRLDDEQTKLVMKDLYEQQDLLVDPHTAVGLGAARAARRDATVPMVCLATAHPAKFPDAVEDATGVRPPLPAALADLFALPERFELLRNDVDEVRAFIDSALG
jgi:threonine synthase